ELAALLELHAEIARPVALSDLVDRNDPWMLKTCGCFGLATEAFQVRFTRAMPKSHDFKRHEAIQTFLASAINNALAAAADFLQGLVIAKLREDLFVLGA